MAGTIVNPLRVYSGRCPGCGRHATASFPAEAPGGLIVRCENRAAHGGSGPRIELSEVKLEITTWTGPCPTCARTIAVHLHGMSITDDASGYGYVVGLCQADHEVVQVPLAFTMGPR